MDIHPHIRYHVVSTTQRESDAYTVPLTNQSKIPSQLTSSVHTISLFRFTLSIQSGHTPRLPSPPSSFPVSHLITRRHLVFHLLPHLAFLVLTMPICTCTLPAPLLELSFHCTSQLVLHISQSSTRLFCLATLRPSCIVRVFSRTQ